MVTQDLITGSQKRNHGEHKSIKTVEELASSFGLDEDTGSGPATRPNDTPLIGAAALTKKQVARSGQNSVLDQIPVENPVDETPLNVRVPRWLNKAMDALVVDIRGQNRRISKRQLVIMGLIEFYGIEPPEGYKP